MKFFQIENVQDPSYMFDLGHAVVLVLTLVTILCFNFVPRYKADSGELLFNGDFQKGLAGWKQQSGGGNRIEKSGIAVLENSRSSHAVFLRQSIPVSKVPILMKLTGEAWAVGIVEGEADWHKARFSLVARDKSGKILWNFPHQIKVSRTTKDWRTYSRVFKIPSEAVEVIAGMEIIRATGVMHVRSVNLTQVKEYFGFSIAANILQLLWGAAIFWFGNSLLKLFDSKLIKGLLLVICAVIIFGVLTPCWMKNIILADVEDGYSNFIGYFSHTFPGLIAQLQLETTPPISLDIFGHFVLFAMLAFICRIRRSCCNIQPLFINLLLFASTTEVLQFFTFGRNPEFTDWMVDSSGLLFGLALSGMFHGIRSSS